MKTFSYKGKEVYLQVSEYAHNPIGIAVQMYDASTREPEGSITTNLGSYSGNMSLLSFYCNFVDINNFGVELLDFLKENDLGEFYTRFGEPVVAQSGFAQYPLFAFNPKVLQECDPTGCREYEESYRESFEKERQKLIKETKSFFEELGIEDEEELVFEEEELDI